MTPYKVQLVQELKPIDHPMRFRFATEDADFGKKKIIFSYEAHFDLGEYVSKQNCSNWSTKIRTYTLQTRRTQNELLLGADFGPKV